MNKFNSCANWWNISKALQMWLKLLQLPPEQPGGGWAIGSAIPIIILTVLFFFVYNKT